MAPSRGDDRLHSTKSPEIERNPVTREYLAVAVANGWTCNHGRGCNCGKMDKAKLLYEGIKLLVYKNVQRYVATSRHDFEDLSQACFLNIWKNLGSYNPDKGAFSTWVWYVCRSVLNSRYARDKKYRQVIDHNLEDEPEWKESAVSEDEEPGGLEHVEVVALRLFERFGKYNDKRRILVAMFGDPEGDAFPVIGACKPADVARRAGLEYSEVFYFYRGPIRRMFEAYYQESP